MLPTVRVIEERFEGPDALRDSSLHTRPLVVGDDTGHSIQREGAFLTREIERDALREVRTRKRIGAAAQLLLGHLRERLVELAVRPPRLGRPILCRR